MASQWLQCKYLALIHSKYNYHASWQSWLKRGPAHARIHWYGKGWRTSWDANNRGISPAFRHRWILEGLLWTGLLALDRGARPRENILGFFKAELEPLKNLKNEVLLLWKYLICLPETVDPPHLALLVWIWQYTHGRFLASDGEDKIFSTLLSDVFPEFSQEPWSPFLLHLHFFRLKVHMYITSNKQ